MANFIDLTGKTFGLWTVLRRVENAGSPLRWECRCECGAEKTCDGSDLRRGKTVSCGCYRAAAQRLRATKHGNTKHPLYSRWKALVERCSNPKSISFERYGARGIRVCDRWLSFETFLEDMGAGHRAGLSIERIDNSGNYEPANCRWATAAEQARNTRRNVVVDTPSGKMTLLDACALFGVPYNRAADRYQRGWPVEKLFVERQKPGRKKGMKSTNG